MHICVLYGGVGGEREVSLASGLRVTEALLSKGHRVHGFDFSGTLETSLLPFLKEVDAVFLALHGGAGEGGALQTALEEAGILHYTGSAPAGAIRAMNKAAAKACVQQAGVPTAADAVWLKGEAWPNFPLPAVVKPLCGGSSVGLFLAKTARDVQGFCPEEPMLAEALLTGREYTVGVLAGHALPVVEIRPHGGIYDYRRKYTAGETNELCPAPIPAEKATHLQALAMRAFEALGLRDYARMDFKEDAEGRPHFLEANTLPGMTVTSLLPLAAKCAGIDFSTLCEKMAKPASLRKR